MRAGRTHIARPAPRRWRATLRGSLLGGGFLFAALAFLLFHLQGCTLFGALIGGIADGSSQRPVTVQAWETDRLPVGSRVKVFMVDGSIVPGTYRGVVAEPPSQYERRFVEFVAGLPERPAYPAPGDTIDIVMQSVAGVGWERSFRARLMGYDIGSIVVREPGQPPEKLNAYDITTIGGARPFTRAEIWAWLKTTRAPLLTNLLVLPSGDGSSRTALPVSDIDRIEFTKKQHGAATGAMIGLAVDAAILVVILASQDNEPAPPPPPSGGDGSCPFLYAYDGHAYQFDAEAFSGAIVRKLQQTDRMRLDHLVAIDGLCRVRVANELPETQYVDRLDLLAVDHPRGTALLPAGGGGFHTLRDPQAAFSAVDHGGCVMTAMVAGRDSLWWVSNPLGRAPECPATLRDGMVLRFRRPAGAERVKLVFTLKNTRWLTELEHRLLDLPGAMLPVWYARMNTSPGFRGRFEALLRREMGLRVDLRTGDAWQPAGHLQLVGPFVARSLVLPVDLPAAGSPEIEIRVESTPGLWMVDCVQADFSPDLPVQPARVTLRSARDRNGVDVRGLLALIDGGYYRLETGDRAELEFAVAPPKTGLERTYVALCDGYYTLHVKAEGPPRLAEMRKLAGSPGAFSAYTVDLVNAWVSQEAQREPVAMIDGDE